MSDQQPPAGTPEYLDSARGPSLAPPPEEGPTTGGTRRRTAWLVGGGLVGAVALGAGAWAAVSFFSGGAQPAEALPSTTIAYVSVDLDPSGSQKIDAFRTLNKFPAFKDEAGIHSVDDVREKLGDALIKGLGCDGLSFADDIDPWLGERAAVAVVDLGRADPAPVSVVQVTDDGKAEDGLKRLASCGGAASPIAYDVHDGWAVLAGSQGDVSRVVSETEHASLADDATYQRWTEAVGGSGVVNLYAAPAAGDALAGRLGSLRRGLGDLGLGAAGSSVRSDAVSPAYGSTLVVTPDDAGEVGRLLGDFEGAAATVRFTGDGLELATASAAGPLRGSLSGGQGGTLVQDLPDDTAAAVGVGLAPGWLGRYADRLARILGSHGSGRQMLNEMSKDTGLDLPDDAETLLGTATALSIAHDFDLEAASASDDGDGVPVALSVRGDSAAIQRVLDKVRAHDPAAAAMLGSDAGDDRVVIGPSAAYRQDVLAGGHLGDSDAFRSVVPDADHAGVVLFVDLGALRQMAGPLLTADPEAGDNLAPLEALGFSSRLDGDIARTSLRISTR